MKYYRHNMQQKISIKHNYDVIVHVHDDCYTQSSVY